MSLSARRTARAATSAIFSENGKIGSSLADENALVHLCPSEHYTWAQCVQKMDEFSDRYKMDVASGTMSNLTAEIKAWRKAEAKEEDSK